MQDNTITRIRGDTYADRFLVSVSGAAVDLTGCSLKLTLNTVRNPEDTSTQVYQLDGIISLPSSGIVEFAPSTLQADQVGYFYYDIQMSDSNGIIRTLVTGMYEYVQDITK